MSVLKIVYANYLGTIKFLKMISKVIFQRILLERLFPCEGERVFSTPIKYVIYLVKREMLDLSR